ncbi:ribosome small subunit-dependent GTPase A [Lawsonella clevelandensis]|uniref:ribosome small subunit-dependent GTPase A n=1 Tax=Lawsonella clevelandensis TaxID=1528099 RepID=UPI0026EB5B6E|nr:ribosome small subunit-dependent GTPase A [Lawsonella clevelandensis]
MALSTPRRGRSTRDYDESDVHTRPKRTSRPRTKKRPSYTDAVTARIVTIDRGRWLCALLDDAPRNTHDPDGERSPAGTRVTCIRARTLGRERMVVGDLVDIVGDLSGSPDAIARIVRLHDRDTVLRRTADDTDPYERIVVANADQLLIVVAATNPPPREGFVERALIAAYAAGIRPILCMTKSDLADPTAFLTQFTGLDLPAVVCGTGDPTDTLLTYLNGHVTALIGHSGVGKSTLVNRLVPEAERPTGDVSKVGKGQHTSTQSMAMELPGGGWVIDSPGIRSFGLAHVTVETVVGAFDDLSALSENCPRGCTHRGEPFDKDCAWDEALAREPEDSPLARRIQAVRMLLIALHSNDAWSLGIDQD